MKASLAINASLEPTLVELVKIRASQINGCANCLNMHTAEARAQGETEQRLYLLPAWREAPCYSERERAALAWTEALTRLSEGHTHEAAYEALEGPLHRGGAGEAHAGDQRHQRLEPPRGGLRHLARAAGEEDGGVTGDAGHRDAAAVFDPLRPRLTRVAYRMLGSVADAEDVVQEAFIRWMGADRSAVREPEAFLRRTVTRLCLDQLKSARRRREIYVGPWLPEPVVEEAVEEEDVTLPLMLALERLSPLERAAFLLHDVFGVGFEEIAATVRRSPAACRQLAARARTHVREARPRFRVEKRARPCHRRGLLRRVARRRHGGARSDARRRCQPACRRRRQAAGGVAADPRLRGGDAGARGAGRGFRKQGRRWSAPPSSTACRAS